MKARATGSRVIAGVAAMAAFATIFVGAASAAVCEVEVCTPWPTKLPTYPTTTLEYLSGPLAQQNMEAKPYSTGKNKMWLLPATPATTQWGVFDNTVTPALRINSGDTVAIETLRAGNGQVVPGISIEQLITINTALPGRGPHTVTGPIYVNGAEPGDVVAVHINKIRMLSNATNNSSPTGGLFPEIFPSRVDSYYLDNDKMEAKFTKNIVIPLAPFPGILAVGRPDADSTGRLCTVQTVAAGSAPNSCNTVPPGDYGGNLDLKEMQVGSTTYLPVFVPGALIWTGDSHAAQGNGEFDLDALETAFPELNVTITLIKNQPQVTWPIVENPTTYTAIGYDTTLQLAVAALKTETTRLIMEKFKMTKTQATDFMYKTWNCPISEVVDIVLGTYCVIPKDRNAPAANPLPRKDNSEFWVTHASNADPMIALKAAVMASIKKISSKLNITADRSYRLSTFVTDCQFGPYRSGPYDITCLVPKSIYRG